jgi:alkyl sulfatase BDS1-like metallo-beta-lactamase superfamily hydrolase
MAPAAVSFQNALLNFVPGIWNDNFRTALGCDYVRLCRLTFCNDNAIATGPVKINGDPANLAARIFLCLDSFNFRLNIVTP